jgi:hypothetical protein
MMKFSAVLRCAAGYLFGAQACRKRQQVQRICENIPPENRFLLGRKGEENAAGQPRDDRISGPDEHHASGYRQVRRHDGPAVCGDLLTVSNVRAVSYRHSSPPSAVDTAISVR